MREAFFIIPFAFCWVRVKQKTPVAIIQDGTTEKEKMVVGNVKDIVFRAQHAGISNPAIIIVGEVVNINSQLLKSVVNKATVIK